MIGLQGLCTSVHPLVSGRKLGQGGRAVHCAWWLHPGAPEEEGPERTVWCHSSEAGSKPRLATRVSGAPSRSC